MDCWLDKRSSSKMPALTLRQYDDNFFNVCLYIYNNNHQINRNFLPFHCQTEMCVRFFKMWSSKIKDKYKTSTSILVVGNEL